ncbi:5' nucleotidase, NT5C type [Phenylobacterium sp.]|uniref:5' nucleotidase, NT5C type n=1 Tax=Phenylobacterium sp. TaxID=1871053 RepID=UPI002F401C67
MRRQIYLDCDGVLADFDKGALAVLGVPAETYERVHGSDAFWKKLSRAESFFEHLDLTPDALELYAAVKAKAPIILTGMPHGKWAEPQKRAWAARHFPGVPVIATMAALKREHCEPGDVLVDDRPWHAKAWEAAGGRFIHHTSAKASIAALRAAGYI